MLQRVKDRAATALRNPELAWAMKFVPAQYRDNPVVIGKILSVAASGDRAFAQTPAFLEAHAAVGELQKASDLSDRVARLYHDPKIQLAAGDRLDWYVAHPSAAYEELLRNPSLLPGDLRQSTMVALAEARDFSAAQGVVEAPIPAKPLPATTEGKDAEFKELIAKGFRGRSEAENARLMELTAAKVEREAAVPPPALAAPEKPTEFQQLVKKSVSPEGVTSQEHARMVALAPVEPETSEGTAAA